MGSDIDGLGPIREQEPAQGDKHIGAAAASHWVTNASDLNRQFNITSC